jgi:hypothetical protein
VRVTHVRRIRGIGGSEQHLLTLLPAFRDHGGTAVGSLLDDRDRARAMGEAGRGRAHAEFSVAKLAERTAAIYVESLHGTP